MNPIPVLELEPHFLIWQAFQLIAEEKPEIFDPIKWFTIQRHMNPDMTAFWFYGPEIDFNMTLKDRKHNG